jgi:hypothetical protein
METPHVTYDEPLQTEKLTSEDAIAAWEPIENDLWIPYRIRGSWRGGVLG